MKCIICGNNANATGSHIVPANLIKNCVSKHYGEESYSIDSKNAKVDVYFGRDNLKNTNPTIKEHHYKVDNLLCQDCEKNLADLESLFYSEFLSKFRLEKFKNNFETKILETEFELIIPNKISNTQVQAYIYSIILRYCQDSSINGFDSYLTNDIIENIAKFVNGFFYKPQSNFKKYISDYNLILVLDKTDNKGSFISSSNQFDNPYLFYFCEVIVKLFTKDISEKALYLFEETMNNINQEKVKIIVGPRDYYSDLRYKMGKLLAEDFVNNGINILSSLNGKDFDTNFNEFSKLMLDKHNNGIKNSTSEAINELRKKYGG